MIISYFQGLVHVSGINITSKQVDGNNYTFWKKNWKTVMFSSSPQKEDIVFLLGKPPTLYHEG